MALRKVFSQDSDFKERMFARQIAVMKGQAWNVVETLKTPDHGPLELTRRTRVCVWDDIVDVPVAIPLRPPSAEMRRRADAGLRRTAEEEEEEEMDISVANASASTKQNDLIELSIPNSELPNPNRFDLSRILSSSDLGQQYHGTTSPATIAGIRRMSSDDPATSKCDVNSSINRPGATRSRTRVSFEERRRRGSAHSQARTASISFRQNGTPFLYDGDDLEGDLGYAAAEGMEGNQRKVIMERLETVKSKNPVFTWC